MSKHYAHFIHEPPFEFFASQKKAQSQKLSPDDASLQGLPRQLKRELKDRIPSLSNKKPQRRRYFAHLEAEINAVEKLSQETLLNNSGRQERLMQRKGNQ